VLGVVMAAVWAGFWTTLILLVMKYTRIGLRVDESNEVHGIDATEHSETAYHELFVSNDHTRLLLPHHYGSHSVNQADDHA